MELRPSLPVILCVCVGGGLAKVCQCELQELSLIRSLPPSLGSLAAQEADALCIRSLAHLHTKAQHMHWKSILFS